MDGANIEIRSDIAPAFAPPSPPRRPCQTVTATVTVTVVHKRHEQTTDTRPNSEEIGEENMFAFGLDTEGVDARGAGAAAPPASPDPRFQAVVGAIASGEFGWPTTSRRCATHHERRGLLLRLRRLPGLHRRPGPSHANPIPEPSTVEPSLPAPFGAAVAPADRRRPRRSAAGRGRVLPRRRRVEPPLDPLGRRQRQVPSDRTIREYAEEIWGVRAAPDAAAVAEDDENASRAEDSPLFTTPAGGNVMQRSLFVTAMSVRLSGSEVSTQGLKSLH